MTFIETITALVIIGLFLAGFSQAFLPAYNAWEKSIKTYHTAHALEFIANSFKYECASPDRNIERWKLNVSTVKELEQYNITEYRQEGVLRALKATCLIGGETIEIIGECAP